MKNQTKYLKKSQNVLWFIGGVIGNNSQAFQPMWLGDAAQPALRASADRRTVYKMLLDLSGLFLFVTDSNYQKGMR